jgi:hypothetical protein
MRSVQHVVVKLFVFEAQLATKMPNKVRGDGVSEITDMRHLLPHSPTKTFVGRRYHSSQQPFV